jgi:transposase
MLIVGHVFAIRSDRRICTEVQVNLACRWFCRLGIEDKIPDHSMFSRAQYDRFRESDALGQAFERVVGVCILSTTGKKLDAMAPSVRCITSSMEAAGHI